MFSTIGNFNNMHFMYSFSITGIFHKKPFNSLYNFFHFDINGTPCFVTSSVAFTVAFSYCGLLLIILWSILVHHTPVSHLVFCYTFYNQSHHINNYMLIYAHTITIIHFTTKISYFTNTLLFTHHNICLSKYSLHNVYHLFCIATIALKILFIKHFNYPITLYRGTMPCTGNVEPITLVQNGLYPFY